MIGVLEVINNYSYSISEITLTASENHFQDDTLTNVRPEN